MRSSQKQRVVEGHDLPNMWCGITVCFESPPPVLLFEDIPTTMPCLLPSPHCTFPTVDNAIYDLRGTINLAAYHFTAQLLEAFPSHAQWSYDGQINNGTPTIQE
jgi:hypothetical protein